VNAPARALDWTEANQRLLVAEFARIKCLLRGEDLAGAQAQIKALQAAMPAPAAIDRVAERFALSPFERDLLLLAAGFEMDAQIGALAAEAAKRTGASFGLALAVLPDAHWSALTPVRPLRRWRLVETTEDASLSGARLRIDERVLHYLAGANHVDARLQPLLTAVAAPATMADSHCAAAEAIAARLARARPALPVLQLPGDDPDGKRDVAATVAARFGLELHAIDVEALPASVHERDTLAALWEREAALADAALLIECGDALRAPAQWFVERVGGLVALAVREAVSLRRSDLRQRIDKPPPADQRRLWRAALGEAARPLEAAVDAVAPQFRLSARAITRISAELTAAPAPEREARLRRACQGVEGTRLEGLAERIVPTATLDELVLPAAQKGLLHDIAAHVRHRLRVHEEWGFARRSARGLGIAALFAGETGTGKTMAAEALANALGLELFRIDLSGVVSKYIGETEKNLARVFDAAESSGAILLFDEADALFGKRSEVKDSHDRYANIEVSYLLQRMEAYRGLAILTSNQKAALDVAFQRRLRFVVHFPFPDAAQREAIWRGIFPAATPTRGLDYAKLARLQVAGGTIRNVALGAAFFAAEEGQPVGMGHLLRAAHADAAKRERPLTDRETRGWV
jgi:ATPase family associated with various cellular activities (AAA)